MNNTIIRSIYLYIYPISQDIITRLINADDKIMFTMLYFSMQRKNLGLKKSTCTRREYVVSFSSHRSSNWLYPFHFPRLFNSTACQFFLSFLHAILCSLSPHHPTLPIFEFTAVSFFTQTQQISIQDYLPLAPYDWNRPCRLLNTNFFFFFQTWIIYSTIFAQQLNYNIHNLILLQYHDHTKYITSNQRISKRNNVPTNISLFLKCSNNTFSKNFLLLRQIRIDLELLVVEEQLALGLVLATMVVVLRMVARFLESWKWFRTIHRMHLRT